MAKLIKLIANGEIMTFSVGLEKGDPTKVEIIAIGGPWTTRQAFKGRDAAAILAAVQKSLALFDPNE